MRNVKWSDLLKMKKGEVVKALFRLGFEIDTSLHIMTLKSILYKALKGRGYAWSFWISDSVVIKESPLAWEPTPPQRRISMRATALI